MQIHELNRPRRADEGFMDVIKGVGKAAVTGLAQAVSPGAGTTQDFRASSAGILDPKKKLDAVMKNSQMARIATGYADAWLTDKRSQVSAAPATTVKEVEATATAPGTYNKKTGAAELGKAIAPTAPGFNYDNVAKMPGVATAATTTQAQTSPAAGSRINKANPDNPNIKDQNKYVQGRAGSGTGGDATKFAKYDPATSAIANAAQGINTMVRGGVAAQQPAANRLRAKRAPKPGAGAGAFGNMANQLAGEKPNIMANAPVSKTNKAKSGNPNQATIDADRDRIMGQPDKVTADPYIKNFLEFANEKVAMRDSATYKMLGLTDAEGSELKPELTAAKEKVKAAQGNPAATKTAVKNYILTAMAALQLVSSQNTVKAASPEAPAYGQQSAPAGQAGKTGQPGADGAAAGTAPATGQLTGSDAVALLNKAGLTAQILTIAGEKIQKATGNKQLSTTGDSVIDTMLEGMGYTVA